MLFRLLTTRGTSLWNGTIGTVATDDLVLKQQTINIHSAIIYFVTKDIYKKYYRTVHKTLGEKTHLFN